MPKPQIDPPGKALSSLSLYSGEAAGEGRVERNAWGEDEDSLGPAVGSFTTPSLLFLIWITAFFFPLNMCVAMSMCMSLDIVTQHTQSISHCSYVLCLSL